MENYLNWLGEQIEKCSNDNDLQREHWAFCKAYGKVRELVKDDWIPVSERLPTVAEHGTKVLIYRIMNRDQQNLDRSIYDTDMVKHCNPDETWWMPLPKPPVQKFRDNRP